MKPLSRRKFISVAASTAATSCLPLTGAGLLAAGSAQAAAASDKSDSRESDTPAPFLLVNPGYKLMVDTVKVGPGIADAEYMLGPVDMSRTKALMFGVYHIDSATRERRVDQRR